MIDAIERIKLDDPKIELRFHTTPESIFNEFWNFEKDMTFGELLASTMGGSTGEGEEIETTLQETFDGMVENKYWAFAEIKKQMIHVWIAAGEQIETDILRIVIGHEIGHILEEKELSENVFIADEQRADNYGLACFWTEKFLGRILFERS